MLRGWRNRPLRTQVLLVLSVPLIPLIAAAAGVIVTAREERVAEGAVTHSLDVKRQISEILDLMTRGEVATKDYLVSRDPIALTRFEEFGRRWPAAAQRLETMIADNPEQISHLRSLDPVRGARPFGSLLDYVREYPAAQGPPPELLDRSRTIVDLQRGTLLKMEAVEDRLLSERFRRLQEAQRRLVLATTGGALLGLLGGAIAALAFSKGITARVEDVRQNSQRLVTGEALRPVQDAGDEIGHLSLQMHRVWELLTARVEQADKARAELDHFFSVSIDLLCIAGTDGTFKRVNPAWQEVLGWTPEELLSRPYLSLVHPDDAEAAQSAARHQEYHDTVITLENRFRCQDGSYRWLSWKSVSMPSVGLVFGAARDVTEQKRIEETLRTKIGELNEANDELESFTYSVSHDLRAPLRHITGFAQLIERSAAAKLDAQERRWLSLTSDAGNRMGRLIDDLLAFSRMSRAAMAVDRVNLDDVVRGARDDVQPAAGDRRIVWQIAPLPEVIGDAALLRLAFVNLLGNAVKYTRDSAAATITIGTIGSDSGDVVVFVRDNGVGFDMKYAGKLFGVFQRLHDAEQFEGTGIGLANVRRIVARHGGRVWAESAVQAGATFYLSLPPAKGLPT